MVVKGLPQSDLLHCAAPSVPYLLQRTIRHQLYPMISIIQSAQNPWPAVMRYGLFPSYGLEEREHGHPDNQLFRNELYTPERRMPRTIVPQ